MSEKIIPIYSRKPENFHWVGFGSGSGTNLRECAKVIKPAMIFSDRPKAKLLSLEELADVPRKVLNGFEECGSSKTQAKDVYEKRCLEFNECILNLLTDFELKMGFDIDLIVLGGYMRLVGDILLEAYPDKIVNVHPSRLPHWLEDNERDFVGGDAVYDAIKGGQASTRSSVIIVDDGVDHGEILTQGPSVAVWGEYSHGSAAERGECLREYADAHQSLQKVRSDWPALTTALKMISEGRIALGTKKSHYKEWRTVYVDGEPMPYEGFQVRGK